MIGMSKKLNVSNPLNIDGDAYPDAVGVWWKDAQEAQDHGEA